jgi:hypothetical protein
LAIKEEPSQNEEEGDKEVQAVFHVLHSEIGSQGSVPNKSQRDGLENFKAQHLQQLL